MKKIDFTKSVGIDTVPQGAIDQVSKWFNGSEVEILTCWHDYNEMYLTAKVATKEETRIVGVRLFDISDKWQLSEDFNTVVK